VISDFGLLYSQCIADVIKRKDMLWNKRLIQMIQAYFEDIQTILNSLKRKANKGAYLWLIVSTSAYAGVEIPVDLIIADVGTKIGWNLEEVIVTRHLRNSTQNAILWHSGDATAQRLRESIIILKNN